MTIPALPATRTSELLKDGFRVRVQGVALGYTMLQLRDRYPGEHPMYIECGGPSGNLPLRLPSNYLFMNSAIGMAAVECRALLFFLGVRLSQAGQLVDRGGQHNNEVVVEQFGSPTKPVTALTQQRIKTDCASNNNIEQDFIAVLRMRNKDLAHIDAQYQNVATRRAMAQVFLLVIHYMEEFYKEMGLPPIVEVSQLISDTRAFLDG